jgi:phospholipase C
VSFIKPPAFQEGHNRYSDSLAEQEFLVTTINRLQGPPEWRDMAILIVYDDSDGLYDHVLPPLVNPSNTPADQLTGSGACGASQPARIRLGAGTVRVCRSSPFRRTRSATSSIIRSPIRAR